MILFIKLERYLWMIDGLFVANIHKGCFRMIKGLFVANITIMIFERCLRIIEGVFVANIYDI